MSPDPRRFTGHGLVIESELDLALRELAPAAGLIDMRLSVGSERQVEEVNPPGALLAELRDDTGAVRFVAARDESRVVLRYPGLCEFIGDVQLTDNTVYPHLGADRGLLAVLGSGALIAVHLTLNGSYALHASCVEVDGEAIAFVGSSGMGKSTLAAMLSGAGHPFVSDDVLRADPVPDADRILVHAGGVEGRLRDKARSLAEGIDGATTAETADGRLALRSRLTTATSLPLRACVVPLPSREAEKVVLTRLGAANALRRLLQFPRIVGWSDSTILRRQFEQAADLAERIPVYEALVPWGPPFDGPSISRQLIAQIS